MNKPMPVLLKLENYMLEIAVLLTRVSVGLVFVGSGYGKLTHLDRVVEFFTSLGIPFAHLQAPFVASVELIAGALLILGLGARLAAFPLIGVMVVAIITAKREEIEGISSLFGFSEFLYIVLLLWLIAHGAGRVSADAWLQRRYGHGKRH